MDCALHDESKQFLADSSPPISDRMLEMSKGDGWLAARSVACVRRSCQKSLELMSRSKDSRKPSQGLQSRTVRQSGTVGTVRSGILWAQDLQGDDLKLGMPCPKTRLFQQAQDQTQAHSRVLKAAYSYLRLKQQVLGK